MPALGLLYQSFFLIFTFLLLRLPAGISGDGNVTLESLTIFRTHEWFGKPSIYFKCQGERKVYLPDVVTKDQQYKFIGEESWQPLTVLEGAKCKRCGLYEEDQIKYDDVFDEWELCPIHFTPEPEGCYTHFKDKEFNVTLLCAQCHPADAKPALQPPADNEHENLPRKKTPPLVFVMVFFGTMVLLAVLYVGYMKWQQKKREEQQARFIKLFEDDEDLEAEFGLKD